MGEFVAQALLLVVGGLMIVGGGSCVLGGAGGQLLWLSVAMALLGMWVIWVAIRLSGQARRTGETEDESSMKSKLKEKQ